MSVKPCAGALLLVLLLMGCGTARMVRLEVGRGKPLEYVPASWSEQVEVKGRAFEEAFARLVLEVPLSVRPAQAGQRVLASSVGDSLDASVRYALRKDYGRWCEAREAPGDCLSLLEDGLGFDAMARLKVAVGFAIDPVWEGVVEEVEGMLNPQLLHAMVVAGLASYVALLAFPEPVVTKASAVLLTAWLVAYLGTGPFLDMALACFSLKQATDRATTFAELEAAGARFGKVLGRNGARVSILLMTAALGRGLAARGPSLPGFPQAARLVEVQVGLRLMAADSVRSITVTEGALVVGLAPSAVAASALHPVGGGNITVKDPHVDVPKHQLDQLASTWAEQRRILIDVVRQLDGQVSPVATTPKGAIFEGTIQVRDSLGKLVRLTLRWFKYTDGSITINTAFIPP